MSTPLDREVLAAVGNGSLLEEIAARLGSSHERGLATRLTHMAYAGRVIRIDRYWWVT